MNVVSANVGAWQLRIGLLNWIHLTFLPLFGLAAYYIYLYRDRVWGSYFLISLVIGLLQLVRGGAWAHPVMEPFVVATVCGMLLYLRASAVRRPVSLVLILQVLVFFSAPLVSGSVFDVAAMPQKNIEADRTLTAAIEDAGGATLSEHIGYQLATGQDTSPEVWGMYEQYDSGRVSAAAVQQFFQQQNYSRIITYKRLYTLPIAPYINRHYTVTAQVDRTDLLLHTEQWRVYEWRG